MADPSFHGPVSELVARAAPAVGWPRGVVLGPCLADTTSSVRVHEAALHGRGLVLKRIRLGADVPWSRTARPYARMLLGAPAEAALLVTDNEAVATQPAPALGARLPPPASRLGFLTTVAAEPVGGATVLLACNEFLCEAGVGLLVAARLLPTCPHYARTLCAWAEGGIGHVLMEHAGAPLESVVERLSFLELQSVALQVLVALAVGEGGDSAFKHHLHLDYVLLASAPPSLHADTLGGADAPFLLPVVGWHARLADFGMFRTATSLPCFARGSAPPARREAPQARTSTTTSCRADWTR